MPEQEGKVAFISGIARGIGRATAVRLASEGADIIGLDIVEPIASQGGPASTPEDLEEAKRFVEKFGRRIIARKCDVRDLDAVTSVVDEGVAELGRLDVVVANAGILGNPGPVQEISAEEWNNVITNNLTGHFNTVRATVPHLIEGGRGGSISLVSSALALRAQPNLAPYIAAKMGVIGLMKTLALELGSHSIRVNCVHPTSTATPLLLNEYNYKAFRPDLDAPTLEDVEPIYRSLNVLPVPYVETEDIANGVAFLASDKARFITGLTLPVDAGSVLL
ncbi:MULTISPECIES: mycofactocin-coupled SDR family oxidoreductase [unclassified Rhodococcus (in: high G+C Gram-positive bacteria)]|uniref:mycofactocin-coupled SDR family oxidoreductase n=1 Tax=unclassified Rhodococcus (in: high G+C Gram-positive bacteria) TaxID=192944 RepID=UPI00163B3D24|nr:MULTISPECIES: mycofactocin-coupled SDR family oxidoreductase [unclassified Rhodococcus (in: high G+C Gram-positive bacteria)]MBC2637758.1 mycofactocin-coupled SDR family oxidoreductase [Rhodococcus sp. 3A]MBC2897497.1 mycofactocin-coupled SDR family oxidoreductase [Rhodococcus sp. 4CII]